jgi:hypothetical protein
MTEEDRVARVARALCIADGNDPDAEVTIRMDVTEDDTHGDRYQDVVSEGWMTYITEARRFVAAARAAGMLE